MAEDATYNQFPRGSIWRKWDLQVHTILDDDYISIDSYWDELKTSHPEKCNQLIDVIGSEDLIKKYDSKEYFFTDSVDDLKTRSDNYANLFINFIGIFNDDVGAICISDHNYDHDSLIDSLIRKSIETKVNILPGVEVNIQGVHILVIFKELPYQKPTYSEGINLFLSKLEINNKKTNNALTISNKSYVDVLKLVKQLGGILIYPHCNSDNGLFQERGKTDRTQLADHFNTQEINILQAKNRSAAQVTSEYIKSNQSLRSQYVFTLGTDARCLKDVLNADNDGNYCWIKSDPTFNGLKQINFEPNERVKLQNQNPYNDKLKIFFDSLRLSGSTHFVLADLEIPLNRELVALIGGRGSGKSALLDTFAFLNEEHLKYDQNNKKKIIEYYKDNDGRTEPRPSFTLETTLINKDGERSIFEKSLIDNTNLELPFLYLGQERLSGIATNDFELTRTICDLIGIDIDEIGQEVITSKARDVLADIENTQQRIRDIIERYKEYGYSNSEDIEKWFTSYLLKLIEQQKRLSSKETGDTLDLINKKTERGLKLKELKSKCMVLMLGLRDLEVNETIREFNLNIIEMYPDFAEIEKITVDSQSKALGVLHKKINDDMNKLRDEIISLKKKLIERGIKEDVNTLLQASENLLRQINNVRKDVDTYRESKKTLETLHTEKGKLLDQIGESLVALRDNITEAFNNFQKSRDDSSLEEKELFLRVIKGIEVEGKIEFIFKNFAKRVLDDYMDNRKITNETDLKKLIAGVNEDGTPNEITFSNLSRWIQSANLADHKCFSRAGLGGFTNYVFTEWSDFLGVNAIAKLNGKATEILSIGQRGTLLLKVYLATATAKQVFIIDQPEDNLDNNFIMNELVPLIRKAKQSRQIIMSTHNANLVVNADAEQIIVARLDQKLEYLSGSIENPEINQNIRDILEGGEEAFRQRERKYLLNEKE